MIAAWGRPVQACPHRPSEMLASANDPAFLFEDLAVLRIVRRDEALQVFTGQEAVRLRSALDIFFPLGRLAHLLEHARVVCDRISRNAARQPNGAWHLELVEGNAGFLAG